MSLKTASKAMDALLDRVAPRSTGAKTATSSKLTKAAPFALEMEGTKKPKFTKGSFKSVIKAQSTLRRSARATSKYNKELRNASLRTAVDTGAVIKATKEELLRRNITTLLAAKPNPKVATLKKKVDASTDDCFDKLKMIIIIIIIQHPTTLSLQANHFAILVF
ncbi:hypothetical protein BASA83_003802 [Batrachochytrium salamandrivorans]|nr:hypothetical protein BASA83_003802 [Batrachochytrium salamandrivorans]